MKLGVCIDFRNIDEMKQKFETLVSNGFDNCQLVCWNMALFTDENAALLNRLTREMEAQSRG